MHGWDWQQIKRIAEEKISECEGIIIETIQTEMWKGKRLKK